jgi:hypothetical protein
LVVFFVFFATFFEEDSLTGDFFAAFFLAALLADFFALFLDVFGGAFFAFAIRACRRSRGQHCASAFERGRAARVSPPRR